MRRAVFSICFLLFFTLFAWEAPKTLRLIYGDNQGESIANSLFGWILIGLLAAACSGALTWYVVRKEKHK